MSNRTRSILLDRSRVTINGLPLSSYGAFLTSDGWKIGESKTTTTFTAVPGHAGSWDLSATDRQGRAYPSNRTVTFTVGTTGDMDEINETKHRLGYLHGMRVSVGGLDHAGEYRGRLALGAWDDMHTLGGRIVASTCEITLDADPYVYGPLETIPITAIDPTTILVKGNAPTPPVFTLQVSTVPYGFVAVSLSKSQRLQADLKAVSGSVDVVFDCDAHKTLLNDNPTPITLDSTYFELTPGRTTVESTHEGRLVYTPRWLI